MSTRKQRHDLLITHLFINLLFVKINHNREKMIETDTLLSQKITWVNIGVSNLESSAQRLKQNKGVFEDF